MLEKLVGSLESLWCALCVGLAVKRCKEVWFY